MTKVGVQCVLLFAGPGEVVGLAARGLGMLVVVAAVPVAGRHESGIGAGLAFVLLRLAPSYMRKIALPFLTAG